MGRWSLSGGGACQEVGISEALAGDREAMLPAWTDTSPQHGTHQELNSHRPAAIPDKYVGAQRYFWEPEWGSGGRWNGMKITSCQKSFLPSYTLAIWISNTNLNINHFEKNIHMQIIFPFKLLSPTS